MFDILILRMLNDFKDYKWFIHILNLGFYLTQVDEILKKQYMLSVLHCQNHTCWYIGS